MTSPATPFRICTKQRHGVIDGKVDVYDANNELVCVQVDLATAQLVEAAPRMFAALEREIEYAGECRLDHHGFCQEHGLGQNEKGEPDCHVAWYRKIVASVKALSASVPERE